VLTWPSFANIDKRQERLLCRWPCVRSLSAEIKVRSRRYVKCYSFEFIVTCIISGRARPEIVLITLVNSLITHSLQVGVGSALVAFCVGTYVLSKYASGTTFAAT
jgi:hypothetical protein